MGGSEAGLAGAAGGGGGAAGAAGLSSLFWPVGLGISALGALSGSKSANANRKQQQQQFAEQQAQHNVDRAQQLSELSRQRFQQQAGTVNESGDRTFIDPVTGQTRTTLSGESQGLQDSQRRLLQQSINAQQSNLEGNEAFKAETLAPLLAQAANEARFRDDPSRQELTQQSEANLTQDANRNRDAVRTAMNTQRLRGGEAGAVLNQGGPSTKTQSDQLGRALAQQNTQARDQGLNRLSSLQQARFAAPGQVANAPQFSNTALQAQGANAFQNQNINSLLRPSPGPQAQFLPNDALARGLSGLGSTLFQSAQNDQNMQFLSNAMGNQGVASTFAPGQIASLSDIFSKGDDPATQRFAF